MCKKYLILDCETATLPCVQGYSSDIKGEIALKKPLIYDIAWQVVDAKKNIYSKKSFLVNEIFSQPTIFDTAYYANKKPIYFDMLKNGLITLLSWLDIEKELKNDLIQCDMVGAYNAMFDYKKALSFTQTYIDNLYSSNFSEWENKQKWVCENIANKIASKYKNKINNLIFYFGKESHEIFDIWRIACETILNTDEYRKFCLDNGFHSKKYFKTSAEIAYRFIAEDKDFIESHTALSDVLIECEIFWKIINEYGEDFSKGITAFPFRSVGKVES